MLGGLIYLNTEIVRTENVYNNFETVLVGFHKHVGHWLHSKFTLNDIKWSCLLKIKEPATWNLSSLVLRGKLHFLVTSFICLSVSGSFGRVYRGLPLHCCWNHASSKICEFIIANYIIDNYENRMVGKLSLADHRRLYFDRI